MDILDKPDKCEGCSYPTNNLSVHEITHSIRDLTQKNKIVQVNAHMLWLCQICSSLEHKDFVFESSSLSWGERATLRTIVHVGNILLDKKGEE